MWTKTDRNIRNVYGINHWSIWSDTFRHTKGHNVLAIQSDFYVRKYNLGGNRQNMMYNTSINGEISLGTRCVDDSGLSYRELK